MALILNASAETQAFTVYGKHFTLKSGQIKDFQEHMARFIAMNRRDLGLVTLPEEFEDIEYRDSAEGKAKMQELRQSGVTARVNKLREIIHNNQVSLRQDLDRANIKADPKVYASEGEVSAYRELVKYQTSMEDAEQRKVDELKDLEKKIKGLI